MIEPKSLGSMVRFLFPTMACLAALAATAVCAERTFTSSDGKTLDAEILAATDSEVTLKRTSDDKEFVVPLERLSEDDRKFIADWLAKSIARQNPNYREERELELTLEGGKTRKMKAPEGTFLSEDGKLTLYPGDTVHLEFPEGGGKALKPKLVKEIAHPGRTVTFALSNQDGLTMLSRSTEIQETVAADCVHRAAGADEAVRADLRPTEKGLTGFDTWGGGVWMIELSNFEVTDREAGEVYQERVTR